MTFDAGHTHGPTAHLVSGCPLCDAAKAARDQAIEHLHEAIHLLSMVSKTDGQPTIRLNLAPIGITGDDTSRCHSVDLTAKHAEALADAIDSVNSYLDSTPTSLTGPCDPGEFIEIDEDRMARCKARFMGWLQGQSGEAIGSGEWTAASVAQTDTDLWDLVNDTFADMDFNAISGDVLNDTDDAQKLAKTRLLDAWFGDIADPELIALYDEDGDA